MGQEIWQQVSPFLVNLAVGVIVAFFVVVGARCQAWATEQAKLVKAKTTKEQRDIVLGIVHGVVQTVEQLYRTGVIGKPAKFNEAVMRARDSLETAGLNPSDSQLADMIEAAVKAMTDFGTEFKKELAKPGVMVLPTTASPDSTGNPPPG